MRRFLKWQFLSGFSNQNFVRISRFPRPIIDLPNLITCDEGAALLVVRSRDRSPVVSLGIFSVVPSDKLCALKSTQLLKMSTRDFSWGKGGRCVWLTTYNPCSVESREDPGP